MSLCLRPRVRRCASLSHCLGALLLVVGGSVLYLPRVAAQTDPNEEPARAVAQELLPTPAALAAELPSNERIIQELDAVKNNAELTEELRTQLTALLTQVQQELATLTRWQESQTRWQSMIDGAPAESERVESELKRVHAPRPLTLSNTSRSELETLQSEILAQNTAAKSARDLLAAEPVRRQQRLTEIPGLISQLRTEVQKFEQQRAEVPPATESNLATDYRRMLLDVRIAAAARQIAALDLEQQAYAATSQLLPKQQELAAKELVNWEQQLRQVEERLQVLISAAGAEQVRSAEQAAISTLEELRFLADDVIRLAKDNQAELVQIEQLTKALEKADARRNELDDDFDYIRKRIETVGLTSGYGALLRSKRNEMNRVRSEYDPQRGDLQELRTTQLRIFEVQEDRQRILRDTSLRETLIEQVIKSRPDLDPDSIAAEVDLVLRRKLDALATLETSCQTHFERWIAVDSSRHELLSRCDEFIQFIEERVLWVRSAEPIRPADGSIVVSDLLRLFDSRRWQTAMERSLWDTNANLVFIPLLIVLLGLLIGNRGRLKRAIVEQGKLASKRSCQDYRPTIIAMAASLASATLWPALLMLIGWRLRNPIDPTWFLSAIGEAVMHTGWFLWPLEIVRKLTRPDGLAEHHFGWHAVARSQLRRALLSYGTIGPVLFLVARIFDRLDEHATIDHEWQNEAGRWFFLALLGLTLLHATRLLHPTHGVMSGIAQTHATSLWYRSRYMLATFVIGGLVAMIILAVLGFYYSSLQLAYRAFQSMAVLLVVALFSAMMRRWLFLRRRRLALRQYRDRLEQVRSRSEVGRGPTEGLAMELPSETELDLAVLNQQTRQLIHFVVVLAASIGLLATWIDVLPALGIIGKVKVWSVMQGDEVVEVSVARVALAALAFLIMVVAVKNVPAVLEITILSHLPLDSGSRFAITTITRYVILIVGLIAGLSNLEIQWSQYGWLVAAATVGLGFGLQEIFANFISGLIVLLERPCRVGDVVTVDGVSGVVTRIQMRATTVTNFDQQELIVPNKEFVTGKLLNWTLSNSINRIVISVGVAYGSDTTRATQLILECATSHPTVMKEPAPSVTFEAFGASSLTFTLRCFLSSLDQRLSTVHDLHTSIDKAFRDANIEMAFPQHDLHLRSVDPRILQAMQRKAELDHPE